MRSGPAEHGGMSARSGLAVRSGLEVRNLMPVPLPDDSRCAAPRSRDPFAGSPQRARRGPWQAAASEGASGWSRRTARAPRAASCAAGAPGRRCGAARAVTLGPHLGRALLGPLGGRWALRWAAARAAGKASRVRSVTRSVALRSMAADSLAPTTARPSPCSARPKSVDLSTHPFKGRYAPWLTGCIWRHLAMVLLRRLLHSDFGRQFPTAC